MNCSKAMVILPQSHSLEDSEGGHRRFISESLSGDSEGGKLVTSGKH